MNTNKIKNSLVVWLLLMISAVTATAAGNTWKMGAMSLKAGAKDTIQLQLENADPIASFQMDIKLPKGVLLAAMPTLSATRVDGHTLSWTSKGDSLYRCIVYSLNNKNLKGSNGTLLSIPIQTVPGFTGGTVVLSEVVMTNPKSEAIAATTDLKPMMATVEKQKIVLNVSGLEQTVSTSPYEITLTTIPAGIKDFTITYYSDSEYKQKMESSPTAAGTYYVKITRAEDDVYLSVDACYIMIVNDKKVVEVIAPEASTIAKGQFLSASILSGGSATYDNSPVPGSFVWTNAATVALEAGSYNATFIPSDLANYNSKEVTVKVDVKPTYFIAVINPTTGGTIKAEGKTSNDIYTKGQKLTLTAIADANYKFKKWTGVEGNTSSSLVVTADKELALSAIFEVIEHTVAIDAASGGSLLAEDELGNKIKSGQSLQKGTLLSVVAVPDEGKQLSELKLDGKAFAGGKYKLESDIKISATFKELEGMPITIADTPKGSIRLYSSDGKAIVSGNTLTKGSIFTIIALPNNGYKEPVLTVEGATKTKDNTWIVNKAVAVSADFTDQTYKVSAQIKRNGPTDGTSNGTLALQPSGDKIAYGTPIRITATEKGDRLVRIVANGKEVQNNTTIALTSNLEVTAVFDKKVNIEPEYIISVPQKYYYNGMSRDFIAYATQTYAFYSFDVAYKKEAKDYVSAVDAGDYDVIVSRQEDALYNKFTHTFSKALVIGKSKITVTEVPTNSENGVTRPSTGVDIKKETTTNAIKFTYTPKEGTTTANNYEGTVYYLSTTTTPAPLRFGNIGVLKGDAPADKGYVRVTNGGKPYTSDELDKLTVGTRVTVEAVAANGFRFSQWQDGKTVNPIEDLELTGELTLNPQFVPKDEFTLALNDITSPYDGTNKVITLPDNAKDCRVSVYSDANFTQPAELKNSGAYFVRIYRPEDETFREFNKSIKYTINPISGYVITPPTASDVMEGETLSQVRLAGGSAGEVVGSFAWSDATKAIAAGSNQYEIKFTPTDPNYGARTVPVSIKGISTKGTGGETDPGTNPEPPTNPTDPESPDQPGTVDPPVVAGRDAETATISWNKVPNANSYKLNLYTDRNMTTLIRSFSLDKDGKLRADAISFKLTGLEAKKTYYVETIAYDAAGKELVKKGIAVPAYNTTGIEAIVNKTVITVSNKTIYITTPAEVSIAVVSIDGRLVFKQDQVAGLIQVPVNQAGCYMIVFNNGHNRSVRKVMAY